MFQYKPMTFNEIVDNFREAFRRSLGPHGYHQNHIVFDSLIYAFAQTQMEQQSRMLQFIHDLEEMDKIAIKTPLGPPPETSFVGIDFAYGTMNVQPPVAPVTVQLPIDYPAKQKEFGTMIEDSLGKYFDKCPKGGNHDWVTWTGLRDTKTDCTKCGALKV